MAPTHISWAEETISPAPGCERKSEGCGMPRPGSDDPDDAGQCYAIRGAHRMASNPNAKIAAAYAGLTHRTADGRLDWTGKVNLLPERIRVALHWRKPRRIFINSMGDLFNDAVPDGLLGTLFETAAQTPQHTYILLTKNHARMRSVLTRFGEQGAAESWAGPGTAVFRRDDMAWVGPVPWPLPNVWVGVSVESQKWADIRIPALFATPAARRWVSFEPLLGPVDVTPYLTGDCPRCGRDITTEACGQVHAAMSVDDSAAGLDWAVVGGESGKTARPMHPEWARSLRDQCVRAAVAFHFKQWGEWSPVNEPWRSGHYDSRPAVWLTEGGQSKPWGEFTGHERRSTKAMYRVGKKAAGRELDGRVWDEYPTVATA